MTKRTINSMPEAMATMGAYQIICQELLKELVRQHNAEDAAQLINEIRARTIKNIKQTVTNAPYEEEVALVDVSVRFANAFFDMIRISGPDHKGG